MQPCQLALAQDRKIEGWHGKENQQYATKVFLGIDLLVAVLALTELLGWTNFLNSWFWSEWDSSMFSVILSLNTFFLLMLTMFLLLDMPVVAWSTNKWRGSLGKEFFQRPPVFVFMKFAVG